MTDTTLHYTIEKGIIRPAFGIAARPTKIFGVSAGPVVVAIPTVNLDDVLLTVRTVRSLGEPALIAKLDPFNRTERGDRAQPSNSARSVYREQPASSP
jgi:hypothetical protein